MRRSVHLLLIIVLLGLLAYGLRGQSFQAAEHPETLRLWILDIGQGDAILLDTPDHHQILVDGGPGSSVVRQLSQALPIGDKEIDLVISTHNDADHLSGLNAVLERYQVDNVWLTGAEHTTQTYKKFVSLLSSKNIPTRIITAGATVDFDALHGIAIWPVDNWQGKIPPQQNATGIVTFWQYGQETILLTADVETAQEQAMIDHNLLRHVDILKVGHHGSHTSSSENFLRAITPKIGLISVGRGNSYGHPHSDVLERYKMLKIPILRTDEKGAIRCDITLVAFSCAGTN